MCIQVDCMHIPVFLCLHIDRQAISTTQLILFLRLLSFIIIINGIRAISPFSCPLCNTPFMSPVVSHLVVHVCLSSASTLLAVIKKIHTLQQRNKTEMQISCNIMSSPCHMIFSNLLTGESTMSQRPYIVVFIGAGTLFSLSLNFNQIYRIYFVICIYLVYLLIGHISML